ncbi:hypothetical protein [Dactylosporangium sp. CA-233914]|uniref:hypothetical protein n=1 Tax=Dactylosporangium sp. CA-233914 TaxID=3239934 RepID=UPI003D8B6B6A
MGVLRAFEDHEYWPEYSTFLIVDSGPESPARVRVDERLGQYGVDTQPCGSIARAGDGWVDGRGHGQYHYVRLEVHDEPPPADDDWPEIVESPFCTGGVVGLSMVTGGARDSFRLGEPGLYRMRFCRRPGGESSEYLVRFWPVDAPVEPPRWIARSAALLGGSQRGGDGFRYGVADLVMLVLWAGEAGAALTVAGIADRMLCSVAQARAVLSRAVADGVMSGYSDDGADDAPLSPTVHAKQRGPGAAPGSRPVPASAAGPARPPVAHPATAPHLATPTDVATASDPAASPVARRPAAGPAPEVASAVAYDLGGFPASHRMHHGARLQWVSTSRASPPKPNVPEGPPPKAGFVGSNGELVVWRDGAPIVLATWPRAQVTRAMQTRHGTVLLASTQAALVRPDGEFVLLGTGLIGGGRVDADGEHFAAAEHHLGRRAWSRVHCFTLGDGTDHVMPPGRFEDMNAGVYGIHGGFVYAHDGRSPVRWRPGEDPEPLPFDLRQIDPYSGVMLARDRGHPTLLVRSRDNLVPLEVDPLATLAPGGRWLQQWVYNPPMLMLHELPYPVTTEGRGLQLPGGSQTDALLSGPVWEDATHVLVPARHGTNDLGVPLVRLDVTTGAIERVPLPQSGQYRPIIVAPLWTD